MGYRGFDIIYSLGQAGLNGSRNPDQLRMGELIQAKNTRFDDETVTRSLGLTPYDSTAISGTPTCYDALSHYVTSSSEKIISVWSDGKIYKESSGDIDAVTLSSGFSFTQPVTLVPGGYSSTKKLLMFSDGVAPHILSADGATTSALSNIPAGWTGTHFPAFAINHDGRIYAFAPDDAPHSAYASKVSDHSDFSTGNPSPPIFSVAPGYGNRIAAATSFNPNPAGQSTQLIIFKWPIGIFAIDTTNVVSYLIPMQTLSRDLGVAGPHCVVQAEGDVFFIAQNGHIYSLLSLTRTSNPQDADITNTFNMDRWLKNNVNLTESGLRGARLIYHRARKELSAYYPATSGSVNSKGLIFDFSTQGNVKVSTEDRGEYFNAAFIKKSSTGKDTMYTAGSDGLIYSIEGSDVSINGAAFATTFEIPQTDFGFANPAFRFNRKRFDWLDVSYVPASSLALSIQFLIDGQSYRTASLNLTSAGFQLDSNTEGVLDQSVLSGAEIGNARIRIGGSGNRLGCKFTTTDLNKNFRITRLKFGVKGLGSEGEK